MKQYTANNVASLSPRSGLILGSAMDGEAASGGIARISGVAALMAGAPRGRVPDACGAIVAVPEAGSPAAPAAHNTTGAPGTRHRSHLTVAGACPNHPLASPRAAPLTPTHAPSLELSIAGTTPRLRSDYYPTLHVQHEKTQIDHEKEPGADKVHAN